MCQKVGLSQELGNKLIGQIGTTEVKEELKRTTQEALDLGVRGRGWYGGGAGVGWGWDEGVGLV